MGGVSIWHWIVVGVIVMLLFGRGKVSELMGDVAKGIKSFKKGMAEDDEPKREPNGVPGRIEAKASADPVFDRDGNRIRDTEI